jgi:ribosomal-protein-alanine N-acetyltransferase
VPEAFAPAVLEAPRVTLRWIGMGDADALFALYGDPQVARYLSRPAMIAREEATQAIERTLAGYADGSMVNFAVVPRGDDRLVGTCLLFRFHDASRRAEIGYSLARPHWGRGLMHEALTTLIDYAFGPLELNRLEADIDPRNAASAKSLERLGFAKEGVLRERWIVAGEVSDTGYYGLLARDWASRPR